MNAFHFNWLSTLVPFPILPFENTFRREMAIKQGGDLIANRNTSKSRNDAGSFVRFV